MADAFKHDVEGISKLLDELKKIRENYNSKVDLLKALIDEISTSNAWIDINVKQEFINTINSYLELYKKDSSKMEVYEKYLAFKSGKMSDVEYKHTLEGVKYE